MPTVRQLVKKGRKSVKSKTKSPALSYYFNTIHNRPVDSSSPFKRGVCLKVFTTIIDQTYKTGKKVALGFKETMEICFDNFLPQWNYTAKPQLAKEL